VRFRDSAGDTVVEVTEVVKANVVDGLIALFGLMTKEVIVGARGAHTFPKLSGISAEHNE
jgi:hypothetical protein